MQALWLAANDVADELSASPTMARHAWVMAHWRVKDPPDHPRKVLHDSRMGSMYEAHPLMMAMVLVDTPEGEAMGAEPEGVEWLRNAMAVAIGFGRILEWLRAALPRYPRLLVPQIDLRSNRSLREGFIFGLGCPWMVPFRREAPQLRAAPDLSTLSLPDDGARLLEGVRALVDELAATPQWRRLADADTALTDSDAQALRALRRAYRAGVADEVLDAVEPSNLKRRHQFREAVMAELLETAQGRVRDYLSTFAGVDELICAVGRVLEHLVVFGPPSSVGAVVEGTWRRAPFGQRVRLVTREHTEPFFRPTLVEVRSEIAGLGGVVLGESSAVSLQDFMTSYAASMDGLLLPNSSGTLTAGPAWS